MDPQTISYGVTILVVALILYFRIRRATRARRIRISRLWIRPLLIVVLFGLILSAQAPLLTVPVIAILIVCGAAGFAFGWVRGKMVRVSIDADTHELTSQASPWGVLILFGIIGVRVAARMFLADTHDVLGIPVIAIIDGLMVFYAASMIGLQIDVWLRAKRLLVEAQAAHLHGQVSSED